MRFYNPKEDKKVQAALVSYAQKHDLELRNDMVYEIIIDGIQIRVEDHVVLIMGLHPMSNYAIDETKYTDKYLRSKQIEVVA